MKIIDDEIHFGVERAGHSGGYWFVPTFVEYDGKIVLKGTIQRIVPKNNKSTDFSDKSVLKRFVRKFLYILFCVLVTPIALIFVFLAEVPRFFDWIKRKVRGDDVKEKTPEDKLIYLMENTLGCVRK